MPNGKSHTIATFATHGAVIALMLYYYRIFLAQELFGISIGFLITLYINPDMDLRRRFPRQRPIEWLPWLFTWPYSRITYHRSLLSHGPVIGTAFRIFYICAPIWVLFYFAKIDISPVYPILPWVALGMVISDTIHVILDITVTSVRRSL
jgi:uncharacterized metal-binding protein